MLSLALEVAIACDFVFNKEYNILNSQLSDFIIFDNEDRISIQFDIKLIKDCDDICNIFEIESDQDPIFQFTIDGDKNYIQVTTINNDDLIEDILIPNANQILPSNSQYHTVNITMSAKKKIVSIDGVDEYVSTISNPRSYQPIYLSSNNSYPLIINNPSSPSSIGSVRNICISSMTQNISIPTTKTSPLPVMESNSTIDVTLNNTGLNYIFVQDQKNWFSAELYCQNNFGTHLGTIISDEDLKEAIRIINDTNKLINDNYDIWIGLNDILNEGDFVWIDGTSCDYVTSGDCRDDPHWIEQIITGSDYHCGRINVNTIFKDNEGSIFINGLCDLPNRFFCNGM